MHLFNGNLYVSEQIIGYLLGLGLLFGAFWFWEYLTKPRDEEAIAAEKVKWAETVRRL